jgi:hypothetical protein
VDSISDDSGDFKSSRRSEKLSPKSEGGTSVSGLSVQPEILDLALAFELTEFERPCDIVEGICRELSRKLARANLTWSKQLGRAKAIDALRFSRRFTTL